MATVTTGGGASCPALSVALTQPALGLPAAVLDHLGWCCPSPVPMSTDGGRLPLGPGPCDQDASGMGVSGLGDGTLPALVTRGRGRGDQAQAFHPLAWGIATGASATCGHHGHGGGTLPPAPGLQGVDHRGQAPRWDRLWPVVLQTLAPFGVCVHRSDVCVQDEVLGRGPLGPAPVTASLSTHAGRETALGGRESAAGVCTRPGEITAGLICHRGAIDTGQSPRAPQSREWHGVTAVRCDPIPRLLGKQCGGHAPTIVPRPRELAVEPGTAGSRCLDADQMRGRGLPRAAEVVTGTLAWADGPEGDDRGGVVLGDLGHGAGILGDIQTDGEGARVTQG
jgi:hypothetical protein